MKDLSDPRLIHLKGGLFLLLGLMTFALLVVESPRVRTVLLLGVCIWAFARYYYYLFYVIGRYVDEGFRFSGLLSFLLYLSRIAGRRRTRGG